MAATLSAASAAAPCTRRAPRNNKSRTAKTTTRGFGDARVERPSLYPGFQTARQVLDNRNSDAASSNTAPPQIPQRGRAQSRGTMPSGAQVTGGENGNNNNHVGQGDGMAILAQSLAGIQSLLANQQAQIAALSAAPPAARAPRRRRAGTAAVSAGVCASSSLRAAVAAAAQTPNH